MNLLFFLPPNELNFHIYHVLCVSATVNDLRVNLFVSISTDEAHYVYLNSSQDLETAWQRRLTNILASDATGCL